MYHKRDMIACRGVEARAWKAWDTAVYSFMFVL